MNHPKESEILLIVNGHAGSGSAITRAKNIRERFTGISQVKFEELIGRTTEDWIHLLSQHPYLCVLGGDGTSFSVLSHLYHLQQFLDNLPTVIALGSGGENVLAKAMNTFADDLAVIQTILEQTIQAQVLREQLVRYERKDTIEEIPSFWNVHAAFSAAVLFEIEKMRNLSVGDFKRRYLATVRQFLKMKSQEPVLVESNLQPSQKVLELGIITAQLPFWTSKVKLRNVSSRSTLSVISADKLETIPESIFYSRLILEMLSLKFGIPLRREILTQRVIDQDEEITITDPHARIAVDSEVLYTGKAKVSFPDSKNQSKIHVGLRY